MTGEGEPIEPGKYSGGLNSFFGTYVDAETGMMVRTWNTGRVETLVPVIFGLDAETGDTTVIWQPLEGA